MEFEDQDREEMKDIQTPSYDSLRNSLQVMKAATTTPNINNVEAVITSPTLRTTPVLFPARYCECQKNQALGIGRLAVDGCGEFMPAGAEGTLDALKCAACNCHRNFHRKETNESSARGVYLHHQVHLAVPYNYRSTAPLLQVAPPPQQGSGVSLALPSSTGEDVEEYGGGSRKKRFTQQQKVRMHNNITLANSNKP